MAENPYEAHEIEDGGGSGEYEDNTERRTISGLLSDGDWMVSIPKVKDT